MCGGICFEDFDRSCRFCFFNSVKMDFFGLLVLQRNGYSMFNFIYCLYFGYFKGFVVVNFKKLFI